MEPNHLYQYSVMNALMAGVAESGIPVSDLKRKGTQGFGTFEQMKGEAIFVNGKVYKMQADRPIVETSPDEKMPYAVATNFVPDTTLRLSDGVASKSALDALITDTTSELLNGPTRNVFVTFRLSGDFDSLRCRKVKGQTREGQPLAELGPGQVEETFERVRGVVVGVRSPAMWQGVTVAGDHLHFIDETETKGGHVLDLRAGAGGDLELAVAVVTNFHVELPLTKSFKNATLTLNDADLTKVEG